MTLCGISYTNKRVGSITHNNCAHTLVCTFCVNAWKFQISEFYIGNWSDVLFVNGLLIFFIFGTVHKKRKLCEHLNTFGTSDISNHSEHHIGSGQEK